MAAAYILAATMLAVTMLAASSAGAQQALHPLQTQSDAATTIGSQLDAKKIYGTDSITADSDVKTLVITIPDNAGTDGSMWKGFLPSNATVVRGTTLVVLNADVNMTHRISMSKDGANQSASGDVPYLNITTFLLDEPGQYTFTDEAAQISETVNVIENTSATDDPLTNESRPAVGLFIAPASAKSNFEAHLNRLGFNAVSSYDFSRIQNASTAETAGNASDNITENSGDITLFVWTQQVSNPNTIDGRLASKVRVLEEAIYPNNATKQNNTSLNN